MRFKLALIIFGALLIRFIALNQSLWLDEAIVARVVQQYGLTQIVREFSPSDFHPPLYYLFVKAWSNLFGYSEVALRAPSVLFSLLTGLMLYQIGSTIKKKKQKEKSLGLWAAVFFLFNPLVVYYSQEARMYMMVTFFVTAILYSVLKLIQMSELRMQSASRFVLHVVGCNAFITLSLLTFYGSIFFIAALYIYLAISRRFRTLFLLTPGFWVAAMILGPLFVQQFVNSKVATAAVSNWQQILGPASVRNLIIIPIKFTSGRISFEPKVMYYLLSGVWLLFVAFVAFKPFFEIVQSSKLKIQNYSSKFRIEILLLFLQLVPILLGMIVSFHTPLLQYFRFVYLIPIMAILLAICVRHYVYRYILLFGFLGFTLFYLLMPQFHREDWKVLVDILPKDQTVWMIPSSADPLLYYWADASVRNLATIDVRDLGNKQLVIIPYTADIHGVEYQKAIALEGYRLIREYSVRGLTYETWRKQ